MKRYVHSLKLWIDNFINDIIKSEGLLIVPLIQSISLFDDINCFILMKYVYNLILVCI